VKRSITGPPATALAGASKAQRSAGSAGDDADAGVVIVQANANTRDKVAMA